MSCPIQTAPKRDSRRSPEECREGLKADEPVPLRELLVYPVVISILNYVCLAFLNISLKALLALFLAMPLEIGGLNLSPPIIGYMAPLVPYSMQFILRASSVVGENEGFSLRQCPPFFQFSYCYL